MRQRLGDMGVDDAGAARFFVGFLRGGVFAPDAHYVRHVLAHAQHAQPAVSVGIFDLGGLQLPLIARGVRHVLKEDIGRVHGQRHPVVLHKMRRRLGVEDLRVGQPRHAVGRGLVRVFRERLVAGQVHAGSGVLGKGHAGHVVQQGSDGLFQRSDLFRFLQPALVFRLFIADHESVQQAGAQHVRDGVQRQVGEPQLDAQEKRHDQPKADQRPVSLPFFGRKTAH